MRLTKDILIGMGAYVNLAGSEILDLNLGEDLKLSFWPSKTVKKEWTVSFPSGKTASVATVSCLIIAVHSEAMVMGANNLRSDIRKLLEPK